MKINLGLVQIVLLILKLTGTVVWSWWVIMIPTIFLLMVFIFWWVVFIYVFTKKRIGFK